MYSGLPSMSRAGRSTRLVIFSVQLQQTGVAEGKESPHNTIILHANEAASVRIQHGVTEKADKENKLVLSRSEFNATAFVLPGGMRQYVEEQHLKPLRRWQAYSQQLRKDPTLVAYYPFEKMASDASTSVLPNRSAVGSELDGNVPGGEWVDGRLPGKMALYFHGLGSGDCVQLPHPERFEFSDAFSIAVWFKAHANHFPYGTMLVTKGEHSWRLLYSGEPSPLGFHTNNANVPVRRNGYYQETNGHTNIVDHRWHLAVAVYEPQNDKVAQKRLYIDGRLDAENMAPMPREQSKSPVWLGANSDAPNQVFSGLIDEVAFFSRALSAEEITAMFRAGNPESCESETQ